MSGESIEFCFQSVWYEANREYRYLAIDKDGEAWIYTNEPTAVLEQGYWDSGVVGESERLDRRICSGAWATSLVEIDDLKTR